MAYVFEGRVKEFCLDCSSGTTYHVSIDVYTSYNKHGEKQYFAYDSANSGQIDFFGTSNIVNFNDAKSNDIFDFISSHYRDMLEIEYEISNSIKTITKVTLLND